VRTPHIEEANQESMSEPGAETAACDRATGGVCVRARDDSRPHPLLVAPGDCHNVAIHSK